MKVEKISDTSLEILLTKNDLDEKNIDINDLLEGDVKSQNILYRLMSEAESKHNITIKSNGLFKMNVLTHSNGDVSIVVSAFDDSDNKVELYKQLYKQLEQNLPLYNEALSKYSAKDIETKIKQKISSLNKDKNSILIYSFNKLSDIKSVLENIDLNFKDELVYKWKSTYYLVLHLKAGSSKKKVESLFSEFTTLIPQSNLNIILMEHGEKIVKGDAKNILKNYF